MHMHKRGVILIELIVVLAIMVILAAAAAIKFGSYDTIKLNAAARKLVADIRYTQHYAMSCGQTIWIDFDKVNDRYSIKLPVSPFDPIIEPLTKENFVVDFSSGELQGVDITNSDFLPGGALIVTDLGFDTSLGKPYGVWIISNILNLSPFTQAGSVTISYKGRTKTISVEPETGRVSLQ